MKNSIDIAHEYYNEALKMVKNNEITYAINTLEKAIIINANAPDILNLLGICHYIKCNFKECAKYFKQSYRINENDRAKKYINYIDGHEFESMIEDYNGAINNIKKDCYDEGINIMNNILKNHKDLIEPHFILGLAYMQKNSLDKSLEHFNKMHEMDKNCPKALKYILAVEELMNDKKYNNKAYLKKYMVLGIMFVIVICALEYQWFSNNINKYKESVMAYKDNLKTIENKYVQTKNKNKKLESELYTVKKTVEGIIDYRKLFNVAYKEYKEGKYASASKTFEKILSESDEQDVREESLFFLASCYERTNKLDLAKEYYDQYIKRYWGYNYYDDSLYSVGCLLYKQGRKDESKTVFTKLVKEIPNSIYNNSKLRDMLNS